MIPLSPLYPEPFTVRLLLGIGLGMAIGGLAAWRGLLSRGGAVAAAAVGAVVFTFGGWAWAVLLILFFITSSLLSRYREERKAEAASRLAKGSRRDAGQVLANGGWVALLALWQGWQSADRLFLAAVGALAAVTADTWATELGLLSPTPPRLITTRETVPPGTNGGVTVLGLLAAATGAFLIGFVAGLLVLLGGAPVMFAPGRLSIVAGVAGLTGAVVDSLLGATVQHTRWCPLCNEETERDVHTCGAATHPWRGWPWLDNDAVNALASVAGSLVAVLLGFLLRLL